MRRRSAHPSLDDWAAWLRAGDSADRGASLACHLAECGTCAAGVELMRGLRGLRDDPWGQLPASARERARTMPRAAPAPRRPNRPQSLRFAASDVRTVAGVPIAARAGRILARSVRGAEISVLVTPPDGEGLWRIRGRVWLRARDPRRTRILLLQQDHVLADIASDPLGRFRMEEALAPGFRLELHLPSGQVVQLEDGPW